MALGLAAFCQPNGWTEVIFSWRMGSQDGRDVTGWGFIPANYLFGDGQLNGLQLE